MFSLKKTFLQSMHLLDSFLLLLPFYLFAGSDTIQTPEEHFPPADYQSLTTPLFRKNLLDLAQVENCMLISLLSFLAKQSLTRSLNSFLKTTCSYESSFKQGHSTETELMLVKLLCSPWLYSCQICRLHLTLLTTKSSSLHSLNLVSQDLSSSDSW